MRPSPPLLVALLVLPASLAAQAPAPFVSVETPAYALYAQNQPMLEVARAQLDSARAEFARFFPGPVPKIHVVVAESREQLERFDVRAMRQRVGELLAWTIATPRPAAAPAHAAGPGGSVMEMKDGSVRAGGQLAMFGNLSAAVSPAPDGRGATVRFVPPSGAADGVDLRSGDIIRAVNGRAGSQAELIAEFAGVADGAVVRLDVEREGSRRALSFAKPHGPGRGTTVVHEPPAGVTPAAAPAPSSGGGEPRILSHEVGHHLFGAWVQARLGGPEKARAAVRARLGDPGPGEDRVVYGHALIADWLDEAAATISESKATQLDRRKHLRENIDMLIPLPDFFTAEHPAMPGLRQMAAARRRAGTADQSGPVSLQVRRPLGSADPATFYAQSLSVAEFIAERAGPAFLATVADGQLQGRTMDQILGQSKSLPSTVAELEREWKAWLAR